MYYRQQLTEFAQQNDVVNVLDILEKSRSIPNIYDHKDDTSYSVLHHSALRGHAKVCEVLIEAGADLLAVDRFNKTALHLAIQGGHEEVAVLLLKHSHPLDYGKAGAKMSLVQTAAAKGLAKILTSLALKGADVNDRNVTGETPLHLAAKGNRLPAVKALLSLGADVHARVNSVGHTPMHYACMHGYKEAALLLLRAGGDAHSPNTTALGRTALETAKDSGFRPLFNALMEEEGRMREEQEERDEMEEYSRTKKHEALQSKLSTLTKTNALNKKELKERRTEEVLLKADHDAAMQNERKNAKARRESKRRVSESQKRGASRGSRGSRAWVAEGGEGAEGEAR